MQTRRLGRTGHESSVAILGGAAFWEATPEEADAGLTLALERGVNHLDIAPQYGAAEDVVGPHLPAVRDRLFLGCKTLRHNGDGVRAQLEASLAKFGTDHVDLYQMHAVTTVEELDQRADAFEAIEVARNEGLTRFVGITGHDMTAPATFVEALRRHDLDTVMFPVYPRLWADPVYRSDAEELLAVCAERDLGVMAIKAVARRPWTGDHPTSPWYEPQTDRDAIERGVAFALSTPGVHAFCTPGSIDLLPRVLDAAEAFRPLDGDAREAASAATADDPLIFPIAEAR
jgi:aryl-alcohol dehydrogenase-like predicted oxidoreductase